MYKYVSLKNKANNQYRNVHATKMQDNYESPTCKFMLTEQEKGLYSIMNEKNNEYYQDHITTMSDSVKDDGQKWRFLKLEDSNNEYYIQNVKNNKFLTVHASKLETSPSGSEIYILEER
ncbi:MAG: hypothetical protein JEZ08_25390 [Clostridiales bacterium]|nr:hypothetical protein [Clostridiales bacterium]